MSLARKKAKEGKSKQKMLPKLKTILANPSKTRCPTLDADELQQLQNLLQSAIQISGLEPRIFATEKHIRLGLESSLRAINNCQGSCVFMSLNIQPKFLVSLVARNAEVKNETTPVYAQPNLEQFTEEVFGVRSLALVLPAELKEISEDLVKWVSARAKPKKVKNVIRTNTIPKKKEKTKIIQVSFQTESKEKVVPRQQESAPPKSWSGDFISFSNAGDMEMDKLKLEEDKDHLLGALSKMTTKIKEKQQIVRQSDAEQMDTSENIDTTHPSNACELGSDDSDDFLQEYQPLTVHKIRPNPDKKPKKKRKKNKNKTNK